VLKFFIIDSKLLIKHYLFEANEFMPKYIRVEQPITEHWSVTDWGNSLSPMVDTFYTHKCFLNPFIERLVIFFLFSLSNHLLHDEDFCVWLWVKTSPIQNTKLNS
jgi:hypothetical protein